MLLMFDSVSPELIPADAPMIAGYVNGQFRWTAADWARFPHARQVRINVTGNPADGGDCLDVEQGDATPAQAPIWYDARHAAGVRNLAIYCNRSTLPAVNKAMGTRTFYRWIATLDGTLLVGKYAAVQFAGASAAGINVDVSAVWNEHWHAPAAPVPRPPGPQLDGYVTWKDATTSAGLHSRGVVSTDAGVTWR